MNAAHLRELIALGIAGEVLVRVAEIIDEASATVLGQSMDKSSDIRGGPLESTAEKNRKERDRIRKKAERAAAKAAEISAKTSTDMSKDASSDSPVLPLTEEDKNRGFQEEVKKKSKKGSRLLIGAIISEDQRAIAIECGCPSEKVDRVWSEFVDYWSDIPGQRGCKLTWTGTWRNWVNRIFGVKNGNATSNHRADTAAGRATTREAEQIAAMGRGASSRLASRAPAGPDNGETSGSSSSAEIFDLRKRAETTY